MGPKYRVGDKVELYNLVGTENGWNGRRGVVMGQHLTLHPQNPNIRAWALEVVCDPPISKSAFFSDKVRKVGKMKVKKTKPNAKCPCGSGKKYKKCCRNKTL